jgi:hypothetical protein
MCAMNLTFVLSALVTGFMLGWLLRTIIVMAEISFSQERMQRKVRYWQSEAALARALARHLSRRVAGYTETRPEWDLWDNSGER